MFIISLLSYKIKGDFNEFITTNRQIIKLFISISYIFKLWGQIFVQFDADNHLHFPLKYSIIDSVSALRRAAHGKCIMRA